MGARDISRNSTMKAVLVIVLYLLEAQALFGSRQREAPPVKIKVYHNGEWSGAKEVDIPHALCSASDAATTVPDAVCATVGIQDRPCTLHSPSGQIVNTCSELHLPYYSIVPASQRFVFIPLELGAQIELPDLTPLDQPITLRTMSQKPKIFEIENFFSASDAEYLINNALGIRSETHRLKRSTTGSENVLVDRKRTSESAFDVSSPIAMKLKRRSLELLRYERYDETVMDGFQILRYNVSAAYNTHYDYIESSRDGKYDSARGGTNRFATILLYLNDVEEGGETVFPNSQTRVEPGDMKVDSDRASTAQEIISGVDGESADTDYAPRVSRPLVLSDVQSYLEAKNVTEHFPAKGFERQMLVTCSTQFALKPVKLRAALFYSQLPDRKKDPMSLHGGCPVVMGQKWLGNLWIWNGPRHEYWVDEQGTVGGSAGPLRPPGKGVMPEQPSPTEGASVLVSFEAVDVAGAHLFWEDTDWGELIPGTPVWSNSYAGHVWSARKDGKVMAEYVVPHEHSGEVHFHLRPADVARAR